MSQRKKRSSKARRLPVEGELTIYRAAALKEQLLAPLREHQEVELDLSGVSEIDSAGLQLLLLAKREATRCGCQLRLATHSAAVVELLELYNLTGYFGDPLVIPATAAAGAEPRSTSNKE